jgi:hypothetical protein
LSTFDSSTWTGRAPAEPRNRPPLLELIDRFVPRHTREEVVEMSIRYEERIHDLLCTIHEYHLRCDAMAKHMHEMEREYYEKVAIPVSFGSMEADAAYNTSDFSRTVRITWRPDPYRVQIVLADRMAVDEQDTPHLFEMIKRQFHERITKELGDQLTRAYLKLYSHFKP